MMTTDPDRAHDEQVQDLDAEFREEDRQRRGPPYDAHANPDIYSQSTAAELADRQRWLGRRKRRAHRAQR